MTAAHWKLPDLSDERVPDLFRWQDGPPAELVPGMLLQLRNGNSIIVGHINQTSSPCNCCRRYEYGEEKEIARWCQITTVDDEHDELKGWKEDRWHKI